MFLGGVLCGRRQSRVQDFVTSQGNLRDGAAAESPLLHLFSSNVSIVCSKLLSAQSGLFIEMSSYLVFVIPFSLVARIRTAPREFELQ